jgi:hypothetical protein
MERNLDEDKAKFHSNKVCQKDLKEEEQKEEMRRRRRRGEEDPRPYRRDETLWGAGP